eukprot:s1827_g11.t1
MISPDHDFPVDGSPGQALARRAGHVSDVVVLGLCLSNMVPLEASGSLTKYFGKSNAENAGGSMEKVSAKAKPKAQTGDQDQEMGGDAGPIPWLMSCSFARAAKREAEPMSGAMDQEVDERVLAELPLNIQEEIRKQMGQMGKERSCHGRCLVKQCPRPPDQQ